MDKQYFMDMVAEDIYNSVDNAGIKLEQGEKIVFTIVNDKDGIPEVLFDIEKA